jgi:hypothetical protein
MEPANSPEDATADWSPVELARAAYVRGDRYFQIDLVVSATQVIEEHGTFFTRTYRPDLAADLLGQIEDQGWALEHVSTSFVLRGWSTAMFGIGEESTSADHGRLVALYVFRRRAV